MKNIHFIVLLFSIAYCSGQEKLLKFRVIADSVSVAGINVVNLVNEKSAVTDANGNFSMSAKEDDLLVLSSMSFEYKRKTIDVSDLTKDVILIKMVPKPNQLDEVVVNAHPNINAVDLGILGRPAKEYTPAERRLKTASALEGSIGIGAAISLDPLLNYLSGRTAMLKKELEVEKRERIIANLENRYEESFYTKKLKIPAPHVRGFLYYAAENRKLAEALTAKNYVLATFALTELAASYNQTIKMSNP